MSILIVYLVLSILSSFWISGNVFSKLQNTRIWYLPKSRDWLIKRRKDRKEAFTMAIFGIAPIVGPIAVLIATQHLGWKMPFNVENGVD